MATPRVFVSSTYYDLKYIRENLKYFIKTIGYDPILSEEGDIFYNPTLDTIDSCTTEIVNCQMMVLIIGGRYGHIRDKEIHSVTNLEYIEASNRKIPIFSLVDSNVLNEFNLFMANKRNNLSFNPDSITFPSVDNYKIFTFIEDVRSKSQNNSLVPFSDFADIESYLRKQWAGMMYSFLTSKNDRDKVTDMLMEISTVNNKIEILSDQILLSVGTDLSKLNVELYESLIETESFRAITYFRTKPTPRIILKNETFINCMKELNVNIEITNNSEFFISTSGEIDKSHYDQIEKDYAQLRNKMLKILQNFNYNVDKYLEDTNTKNK